ncbi:MAG: MFS transporter, partial [Catenulispora sp.]
MRTWSPLIAVCLGTFMLLVDVTIVTVALPVLTRDLHSSLSDLQWVLDGYALALAALLLGLGSVADRLGRKAVYLAGLVVFALASLACGLAPDAGTLIAARFVQGAGAAAMLATTIALLNVAYQGKDRAIAFGVWGAVNGAAAAAGPILGGLLTQHVDWRWIFLVNLPVSVAAVALTIRSVPESRGGHGARFDVAGMATFTVAVGSVVYALIRANDAGWTAPGTLGLFGLGAVASVAGSVVRHRR